MPFMSLCTACSAWHSLHAAYWWEGVNDLAGAKPLQGFLSSPWALRWPNRLSSLRQESQALRMFGSACLPNTDAPAHLSAGLLPQGLQGVEANSCC